MEPLRFFIKLKNASVTRGGLSNVNATSWFGGIPAGITATANGVGLSDTITITFSGTPRAESDSDFNITIPASAQTSGKALSVARNANAGFFVKNWIYTPAESMAAGEEITVFAYDFPNRACVLMLALYKGRALVTVEIKNCAAAEEKSVSIILPDGFAAGQGWTVKAFAWEGVQTMLPLREKFEKAL